MGRGRHRILTGLTREARRDTLAQFLIECEGNIVRAAFRMGYHRSRMYQLIYEYRMWPLVNRLREKRLQPQR